MNQARRCNATTPALRAPVRVMPSLDALAGVPIARQRDADAGRRITTSRYSSPIRGADPILGPNPGARPISRSRPIPGPSLGPDPSSNHNSNPILGSGPTRAEQETRRKRGAVPVPTRAADLRKRTVRGPARHTRRPRASLTQSTCWMSEVWPTASFAVGVIPFGIAEAAGGGVTRPCQVRFARKATARENRSCSSVVRPSGAASS